jgi:alanyl-tRNA synthetase
VRRIRPRLCRGKRTPPVRRRRVLACRDLKGLADAILKQLGSGIVALVSTAEGKASIVVAVSPDHTSRCNAVDLVRAASAAVGGKGGGGRPDLAQAGGPDAAQADAALAAIRSRLAAS